MSGILAIVIGLVSLIAAFLLEGGHIGALGKPTAAMIVFGGTIAATMLSYPIEDIKNVGKMIKVAFFPKKNDIVSLIIYFKELAIKTRKNGLLSLESEISNSADLDPFIKKWLQMIVDGVEPQAVRSILELEADSTSERHHAGASIFEAAGGYAPTMGIIGTVLGLVHVLGGLASSDSTQLGESIATAFIATLYGIGSANILWLPLGSRLKNIDKEEAKEKDIIIEAVLYIQEGVNPSTITEKLKGFLNKEQSAKFEVLDKKVEA